MAITSYAPKVASPRIWRRDGAPSFWAYLDAPGRTFAGDSGDVPDLAGNSRAGIRSGGCSRADGPRGQCLAFDGTGQVSFASKPGVTQLGSGDLAVSMWLNPASLPAFACPLSKGSSSSSRELSIYFASASSLFLSIGSPGSGGVTYPLSASFVAGQWQHLAITRLGSSLVIYRNGAQVGSGAAASTSVVSSPLLIGFEATGGVPWSGLIDDVRLYPRALSAAEVARDVGDPDWRLRRPRRATVFARAYRPRPRSIQRLIGGHGLK